MSDIRILKYGTGICEQLKEVSSRQNLELVPKINATIERKEIESLICTNESSLCNDCTEQVK